MGLGHISYVLMHDVNVQCEHSDCMVIYLPAVM